MWLGKLVDANKENTLKLQALDVLDIEHAHIAFLPDGLTLFDSSFRLCVMGSPYQSTVQVRFLAVARVR